MGARVVGSSPATMMRKIDDLEAAGVVRSRRGEDNVRNVTLDRGHPAYAPLTRLLEILYPISPPSPKTNPYREFGFGETHTLPPHLADGDRSQSTKDVQETAFLRGARNLAIIRT